MVKKSLIGLLCAAMLSTLSGSLFAAAADDTDNDIAIAEETVSIAEDSNETEEDKIISFYTYIKVASYPLYLTAAPSEYFQIRLYQLNSAPDQLWHFEQVDGVYYKIISVESDLALTGIGNDQRLTLSDYTGSDDQLWEIISAAEDKEYSIRLKSDPEDSLVVDVWGKNYVEGNKLISFTYHGGTNQSFKLFDEDMQEIDVDNLGNEPSEQDPTVGIIVEDVEAHPGQTIDVPVTITGNSGIAGFQIKLSYDNEKLVPVSINTGDVISGSIASNLNSEDVVPAELSAVTALLTTNGGVASADGTLFTVTFKITSSLSAIDDIPVVIAQHKVISETQTVDVTATDGVVSSSVLYGDVYSDGEIDVRDLLRLRQYVAEYPISLTDYELEVAHIKDSRGVRDSDIDVMDVLRLGQYLAGWSTVKSL